MKLFLKLSALAIMTLVVSQGAYGFSLFGPKEQMDESTNAAKIEPQQSYRGGDVTANVRAYYCDLVGQAGRPALMFESKELIALFKALCSGPSGDYQMKYNHPNVAAYLDNNNPSPKTIDSTVVLKRSDLKRYCAAAEPTVKGNMNAKLAAVYNKLCDLDTIAQGSKKTRMLQATVAEEEDDLEEAPPVKKPRTKTLSPVEACVKRQIAKIPAHVTGAQRTQTIANTRANCEKNPNRGL